MFGRRRREAREAELRRVAAAEQAAREAQAKKAKAAKAKRQLRQLVDEGKVPPSQPRPPRPRPRKQPSLASASRDPITRKMLAGASMSDSELNKALRQAIRQLEADPDVPRETSEEPDIPVMPVEDAVADLLRISKETESH